MSSLATCSQSHVSLHREASRSIEKYGLRTPRDRRWIRNEMHAARSLSTLMVENVSMLQGTALHTALSLLHLDHGCRRCDMLLHDNWWSELCVFRCTAGCLHWSFVCFSTSSKSFACLRRTGVSPLSSSSPHFHLPHGACLIDGENW